jgi:hypothetical protein
LTDKVVWVSADVNGIIILAMAPFITRIIKQINTRLAARSYWPMAREESRAYLSLI